MKAITDLTAEELALVQAAREKAEQEKAAKQKETNDRVENQKRLAIKNQLWGEKQVKATYEYFKGFKSDEFEVVEYPITKEISVRDYKTNDHLHREDYIVNSAYIQHKESKRKIQVLEYNVSRGYRSENKGFKMFIGFENRAYSKSATVEEKLLNEINSKRAKQTEDEIKESFIAELITNPPFPNATVEEDYMINYKQIQINFENGVKVRCIVHVNEGEAYLSIYSTEFPKPKVEGETVMDKLNFISKLEF